MAQILEDQAGTRWCVLFAGPFVARPRPGVRREIVYRAPGRQFIVEHDWVAETPSTAKLRSMLAAACGDEPSAF